jgi:hypothetical protein
MTTSETPKNQITAQELYQIHTHGVEIKLPSGLNVFLRPVTSRDLMKKLGRIPDELTALVAAMVDPKDEQDDDTILAKFSNLSPEVLDEQYKFLNAYCALAIVSPKVVDDPDPDNNEISPDFLTEEDKGFVLGLINSSALYLKAFRDFQTELNSGLEFESGLSSETEPDLPDSGTGGGDAL